MTYTQVIKFFGSEAQACAKLDLPQSTVNYWRLHGIPRWRQAVIGYYTGLPVGRRRNGVRK